MNISVLRLVNSRLNSSRGFESQCLALILVDSLRACNLSIEWVVCVSSIYDIEPFSMQINKRLRVLRISILLFS